ARPAAKGSNPRASSSSTTRSSATSVYRNSSAGGAHSPAGGAFAFAGGAGSAPRSQDRNFPLGIEGVRYGDLHDPAGLAALDASFRAALAADDPALAARFEAYRAGAELRAPAVGLRGAAVSRPDGAPGPDRLRHARAGDLPHEGVRGPARRQEASRGRPGRDRRALAARAGAGLHG